MNGLAAGGLYLLWLGAGALDFHFHRRSDLAHSSGLRESTLHGVQLLLIGTGALAWLALEANYGRVALLAVLVSVHAVAGYLDTAAAEGRRRISPAEQHVHSVLDVVPWLFLLWIGREAEPGWALGWQPADWPVWVFVLAPAGLLTVLPWLRELRGCLAARRPAAE